MCVGVDQTGDQCVVGKRVFGVCRVLLPGIRAGKNIQNSSAFDGYRMVLEDIAVGIDRYDPACMYQCVDIQYFTLSV